MKLKDHTRRDFIKLTSSSLAGVAFGAGATEVFGNLKENSTAREPIIDIHQHTNYHGRTDDQLLAHQKAMGVTTTILLPAGRPLQSASTHDGVSNGLQAMVTGNEEAYRFFRLHPKDFLFASNEVPDLPEATKEIEKYLKRGARLIGELKFGVDCDSPEMQKIYELADAYNVPVLMHWQHEMYNYGFERFHKILAKYPKVNFIGHAQTWWANIDKNHNDQKVLYPKTKVTAGGLTDRYLSDYSNMYGDLSAGSGLNSLLRDEEQTRNFLDRHQDKLLYGSDCADAVGKAGECDGSRIIAAIRKLVPDKRVERKLLFKNAKRLFNIR